MAISPKPSTSTPTLLGPPTPTPTPPSPTSSPFIDLLVSNFNQKSQPPQPNMILTENFSPTFSTSGNPNLDFFFHILPDTPPQTLTHYLSLSYTHDPLKTLKLISNLRAVRGTGKSDKESYYTSALWLHKFHPKTLASNVGPLSNFGYFKDFPEILYRLLEGPDSRKVEKLEWESRKYSKTRRFGNFGRKGGKNDGNGKCLKGLSREEKRVARAKRAVERFNLDPDFKFLHDCVSEHFVKCLKSDLEALEAGELGRISLAAKWCPSLDSSFDKMTLLCETIGRKMFPREEFVEYEGVEEAHYAYRVRDRLRKEVLVPLRRVLELPEVYIGANKWGEIPYHRVASVAMKLYKDKFKKHDKERFEEYLGRVKEGKAKIAAGALLPHEIIKSLGDGDGGEVAELQWKRMVDDMSKKGKLSNCMAVCDVSGSMFGVPMEVSVALGVLVSELCEEPWKGKLITFSESPSLEMVKGDSLVEKTEFVRKMDWGMNTDFQKVFDLILKVAVDGKLKGEDMIKRLFVFSDMEFDEASSNPWETDYEAIVRKFGENGYGDHVPEIVFWNLRDSRATPVPADKKGVALVSGFSKNLMTVFLEEGGVLDPLGVMEAAISGEEYSKLVVVD